MRKGSYKYLSYNQFVNDEKSGYWFFSLFNWSR